MARRKKEISGAIVGMMAGPWLMAEDLVKALFARLKEIPKDAARMDSGSMDAESINGYSLANGVATIKVVGVLTKYATDYDDWMGFCPTVPIIETVSRAMSDWQVKAIDFLIDSPGGMVAGTSELAEAIAEANKVKPCYARVSDQAASGGYYIASQCRSISCNAMGEVGCIGVYGVLVDDSKFWTSLGVTFTVVSSGGVKGLGADGVVSQELIDDQKRGVVAMYEKFIADVAKGRGMSIDEARKLGDGRCWIAPEALKLGLIDSVESVDSALMAATQETSRMTAEAFKNHAAANPDAAEVKEVKAGAYSDGNKAGKSDACRTEVERAKAITAACPGNPQLAMELFIAGKDAEDAKLTVAAIERERLSAKAATEAKDAELKAKDAEIERLKAQAGTQGAIGTGAGTSASAVVAPEKPETDDRQTLEAWGKEAAAFEWDNNTDVRKGYSNKANFVSIRSMELVGRHKILKK